jgi:VanZ family protein
VVAGWLIVMVTSLEPGPRMPFDLSDKLIHFATFATMTAAVAGFCHEPRGILRWGMLSIMLGGLLELGQHLAPSRSMDIDDFVADAAGAAF